MNILVVGGTGLIGGHAALWLAQQGHNVSIAARKPASPETPLAKLPLLQGDYLAGDFSVRRLSGFDALVFAAGNDIRHLPPGVDEKAHWQRANVEGVPRFFAVAREAGIGCAIYIGSFYPQAAPQLVAKSDYVRGRLLADEGVRALNTPAFRVCSLNAPFVVGSVPGLVVPGLAAHAAYALGLMPQLPVFAMPGGVNFISTTSLSEAIAGALERGAPGKAYLLGDENLSFQDYFGEYFRAAGRSAPLEVRDAEHPLLPDSALYAGRGASLYYEPAAADVALLNYRREDVRRTLREIVELHQQH
ncbi:MAG: NAD-dependent epimerase/dehydratase family protein [Nevskia sp.]|nr:NAD-dependent epimerase/dehydratase family protein [Nevskia sp.]